MDKLFYKMLFYLFLAFLLGILAVVTAEGAELEFGDWYGVEENGEKKLVGFSGTDQVMLTIYVDKQLITRLEFSPARKIRLATFDHKTFRGMNYNSWYGYDHWIRRMKKYYNMRIWFEKDQRCEIFRLNGVSKGINWLHK